MLLIFDISNMRTDIWERVSLHPHWRLHLQPPESSRAIFLAIHKNGAYTQWAHIGGLHSPKPDTSPFKHQNGAISLTSKWSPHPMSRHWWLGYTHFQKSLLLSYREWSHLLAYSGYTSWPDRWAHVLVATLTHRRQQRLAPGNTLSFPRHVCPAPTPQ